MQLNLNVPFKLLSNDGPIPTKTVGAILAEHLVNQAKGDVLKFYGWGIKLTANEPLEIDESDRQTLKAFVEASEHMPIIVKAQILQPLLDLKP